MLASERDGIYIGITINPYTMLLTLTLQVFVVVFFISLLWSIFKKAGQPGWASLIPGYNIYLLLKIVGLLKK